MNETIRTIMDMLTSLDEGILLLMQIIAINIITSATGVLKTIFTAKGYKKEMSYIIFVDSFLFALILTALNNNPVNGLLFAFVFATSKVIGANIGSVISSKIALGIVDISFYVSSKTKMKILGDILRKEKYSVNITVKYGAGGVKRYEIQVTTLAKERENVKTIVRNLGVADPTFKESEVNHIGGKMTA